jgi:hypothetical protein
MDSEEDRREPAHERAALKLDWKDYLAVTIAALESTFLPVLIILLTLIGLTMLIVHLAKP